MLAQKDIAEPRADAEVLVEAATGLDRTALRLAGEVPLGPAAAALLDAWLPRRLNGEPVFRIVGRRPFWSLDLVVTPAVLDPRPDTETLVAAALEAMRGRAAPRLLDLGTGSGAILCALLTELPTATGIGVDRSAAAAAVAAHNLRACGLEARALAVVGDWGAALSGGFDLVVSNPPYIETTAIAMLDREVRDHDPYLALDGGADGLDAYRALAPLLPRLLRPGGVAAVEVGWMQAEAVSALFRIQGLAGVEVRRDLAGHARVVLCRTAAGQTPGDISGRVSEGEGRAT